MSEDLSFAKIVEPEMTAINCNDHFIDRMGEVERKQLEVFPKLWSLRPYDKTNGEIKGRCGIGTGIGVTRRRRR